MKTDSVRLNHAEMVYRPGERALARAYWELLGFEVAEFGPWLAIIVDPAVGRDPANQMFCNEATPAQQKFESTIERLRIADPDATAAYEHYLEVRRAHPQFSFHFGALVPTHELWQDRVDRFKDARENHPTLAGRLDVFTLEPGDPGAIGGLSQAFFHTDVISTGTFGVGLVFEMQWWPETLEPGLPEDELPDPAVLA